MLKQLIKLHQSRHTIILITHELEKVLAHTDRLVIIHKGKLVAQGNAEEVIYKACDYGVRVALKNGEEINSMTWLK